MYVGFKLSSKELIFLLLFAAADKDGPASFWTSSRNAVGEVKEVLRTANLPLHPVLDKFGSNKSVVPAPKAPVNTIAASTPSSSAPLSIVKSPAKPKSAWAATDIAAAADMPAHLPAVATKTVETKTLIAQPPAAEVATKEAPLPKRNPRSARDMKKDVAKNEDAADSTHDSSL